MQKNHAFEEKVVKMYQRTNSGLTIVNLLGQVG